MEGLGGNVTISAEDCAIKAASTLEIGIKSNNDGPKIISAFPTKTPEAKSYVVFGIKSDYKKGR